METDVFVFGIALFLLADPGLWLSLRMGKERWKGYFYSSARQLLPDH